MSYSVSKNLITIVNVYNKKMLGEKINRRKAVLGITGGMASGLAGCLGGSSDSSGQQSASPVNIDSVPPESVEESLNLWNWYDGWVQWATTEFENQYNTSVAGTAYSNPSEWYSTLEAGNSDIDSVSATSAWVVRSMDNDYFAPLPTDRMEGWSALSDVARNDAEEYYQREGMTYAIPETQVAHPLTYNTDYFDTPPDSWDVLWDSDLAGMVSMQDWGEVACRVAALYTGQDPNDPDDFEEIEEALIQQKDLNLTYWTDHSQAQQMLDNEDIVATVFTDGRTYNGRFSQDMPIDMANTSEGFMYTYDTFAIPQSAPNPKAAVAWTAMGTRPEAAVRKVSTMGYLPPISDLTEHLDQMDQEFSEEQIEFLGWPQNYSENATFIKPMSSDLRDRFSEIWSSVKAA